MATCAPSEDFLLLPSRGRFWRLGVDKPECNGEQAHPACDPLTPAAQAPPSRARGEARRVPLHGYLGRGSSVNKSWASLTPRSA
jgi:hypothetical protein